MKFRISSLLLLIMILAAGCGMIPGEDQDECTPPLDTFELSDLYGTWIAGFDDAGYTDTIILREDGYYKQIIRKAQPYYEFESDWLPWWLEFRDGVYYLHLEDMRMCVYWLGMDCEQKGGGEHLWRNFCRGDEWVSTPGEGVLMLLGTPEEYVQPPRGFELVSLGKSTIGVTVYRLQEP